MSEEFEYDALNRLTSAAIPGSSPGTSGPAAKTFTYDSIGNLTSKSDVGSYATRARARPQCGRTR